MLRFSAPLLLLAGCATPIAPTGGPVDSTPPALIETRPADRSTHVTDRTLTLTFSERLAASAGAAVTVTPAGDVAPEVEVRARDVVVTLPELRDSTTYVVTIGTELRDQRNVAIRSPITIAFATGDQIDAGQIDGLVRDPTTGQGVGGLAVWAYAAPDSTTLPSPRSTAPDYQTETGADGAFRLGFLRPGRYFVAAVADRNRNGRADAGERFAAPPRPTLVADTTAGPPVPFWTATRDTIPPIAQRVRALSNRRFSVRFSEPVTLRAPGTLALADSASGARVGALRLYQPPDAPFEVFVETDRPLPPTRHLVTGGPDVVADSAGLGPEPFRLPFMPPERADTVQARVVSFVPAELDSLGTLSRGQRPGVRFSAPPDLGTLAVTVDGVEQPATFETTDGLTVRVDSATALPPRFMLRARTPDSTYTRRFTSLGERDTGGVIGQINAEGAVFVELRPEVGPPVVVQADSSGSFLVDGLRPGPYLVRVWVDRNGDGAWSGGALAPYTPPDPLLLLAEPVEVRARWETELDPISL